MDRKEERPKKTRSFYHRLTDGFLVEERGIHGHTNRQIGRKIHDPSDVGDIGIHRHMQITSNPLKANDRKRQTERDRDSERPVEVVHHRARARRHRHVEVQYTGRATFTRRIFVWKCRVQN